jgi:hypothetical protein
VLDTQREREREFAITVGILFLPLSDFGETLEGIESTATYSYMYIVNPWFITTRPEVQAGIRERTSGRVGAIHCRSY